MQQLIKHFTDNDLYTFTCQYYILKQYPRAEVEYTFFDRNHEKFPEGFAALLQEQVNYMVNKFQSLPAITKAISEEGYQYFLLVLGDTPIGYMGLQPQEDDVMLLSKLYLMKPFRGQRRSIVLLEQAERTAREMGKKRLRLFVNKRNYVPLRVYLRRGFRIMEEKKTDIGEGFVMDDYIMELRLDA